MAKEKKTRAEKYEKKVKFEGSFEDIVKLSVKPKADNRSIVKKRAIKKASGEGG